MKLVQDAVTLAEAAKLVPGGGVALSTLWRWCRIGVRGVKLETLVVGGRRLTTPHMLAQFIAATTQAAEDHSSTPALTNIDEPDERSEATKRLLERKGLLKPAPHALD